MAVAAKTVISFGLVAIPVAMYTATQDNDISFNQLYKEDNYVVVADDVLKVVKNRGSSHVNQTCSPFNYFSLELSQ